MPLKKQQPLASPSLQTVLL